MQLVLCNSCLPSYGLELYLSSCLCRFANEWRSKQPIDEPEISDETQEADCLDAREELAKIQMSSKRNNTSELEKLRLSLHETKPYQDEPSIDELDAATSKLTVTRFAPSSASDVSPFEKYMKS